MKICVAPCPMLRSSTTTCVFHVYRNIIFTRVLTDLPLSDMKNMLILSRISSHGYFLFAFITTVVDAYIQQGEMNNLLTDLYN